MTASASSATMTASASEETVEASAAPGAQAPDIAANIASLLALARQVGMDITLNPAPRAAGTQQLPNPFPAGAPDQGVLSCPSLP